MGEKEIVEGGSTSIGTAAGSTATGGGVAIAPDGPGGGPQTTDGSSGDHPTTQEREDPCTELRERGEQLLAQLKGLHDQNREHTRKALTAFFGASGNHTADGYAHWFTQAEVTKAVVEGSNAVGKTMIDVALFAMGGVGGLSKLGATGKYAQKLEKLFGSGLLGSKDAVDAMGKIGLKVLEKSADSMIGAKAGKIGVTAAKTIDKWDDPKKWFQAPLSALESVARGAVIDALGNWMKEGATSADLARAKAAYADFVAAAMVANAAASAAAEVQRQLEELNAEARARNCPETIVPDYAFHTFDPTKFGEGAFEGQAGPTMHRRSLESGMERDWDLFGSINDQSSLPF